MKRRTKSGAAGVLALSVLWACEDASLFQPEPQESLSANAAPICFGLTSTIYPEVPGSGTVTPNALGGFTIRGTSGPDVISGSGQADSIFGLDGADTICGRGADDVMIGGDGADAMFGGVGVDWVDYTGSPVGVRIGMRGTGKLGHAEGDILNTVEGIKGTQFADQLTGDSLANTLLGMGGPDKLEGHDGPDVLDGGTSADELVFFYADGPVTADLTTATGRRGHALGDTYISMEHLTGSAYGDTLIGSVQANRINGMAGSDVLRGSGGRDRLTGAVGNDRLFGDDDDDILDAGTGLNQVDGGNGEDTGVANCGDTVVAVENLTQQECPASPARSLITADSVLIRANNYGSTKVTIQLIDADSTPLTQGGFDVVLTTSNGILSNGSTTNTTMPAVFNHVTGLYELSLVSQFNLGTAVITGTIDGAPITDVAAVTIGGQQLVWTGNTSTSWTTTSNWDLNLVPNAWDSVTVPTGRPNYPVLAQNTAIMDITIAEGVTVSLGNFDLTAGGNIYSPQAGGFVSGRVIANGTAKNISGNFNQLRIFGSYSLTANLNVTIGRLFIQGGRLRSTSFRIRVRPS